MSSTSQGEGWWQASDGNWYPPSSAPGGPAQATVPPFGTGPTYFVPMAPCPRCGNAQPTDRVACGVCEQVRTLPIGVTLTSAGRRFGQYALDVLLVIVTLFIGWVIWSLIIWSRGQTPGMQILHIRVVKLETNRVATWGTMCLREFVGKFLVMGIISSIFFPAWVVLVFMLMWDKNRQELWDKIAGTIVVDHLDEIEEVQLAQSSQSVQVA